MDKTPKGNRLHIALFGRTNVGKSSLLNLTIGQDIAITSPVPGTTTDVVEKAMELLPLGPVLFLDTAGLDDTSSLSRDGYERLLNLLKETIHDINKRKKPPYAENRIKPHGIIT